MTTLALALDTKPPNAAFAALAGTGAVALALDTNIADPASCAHGNNVDSTDGKSDPATWD